MSSRLKFKMIIRLILLLLMLTATSWLIVKGTYVYVAFTLPVIIFQIIEWFRFQNRAFEELGSFIESVKYKDFSRHFNISHAPAEVRELREGFNQINEAFRITGKEKEMQYHYLQKILEMVNTGILSYETHTGEIIWMNESLKQMLQLPYLKTIHSLQKREEDLYLEIINLKTGSGTIANIPSERGKLKILISATSFHSEGKIFKLIAFQNINEAVDVTETQAWQKLLSVMTHEIMNSVAPISSLAGTLKNKLESSAYHFNNDSGEVDDLSIGIETIKKRSEGLLKFAETYRNLNKITKPSLQTIFVRDLFESICNLMQPTFTQKNIEVDIVLKDPGLMVELDPTLIDQVLINLVVNAIEAVKEREDKKISMTGERVPGGKVLIKVADNGQGMERDLLEQIFIPFFTTKKTGSGIGLSLCKQIMLLHKGNIEVQSKEGDGTMFTLQFG